MKDGFLKHSLTSNNHMKSHLDPFLWVHYSDEGYSRVLFIKMYEFIGCVWND